MAHVHQNGPVCSGCDQKLATAHPYFKDWFYRRKAEKPTRHIAWAARDQEEQTQALIAKKTRLPWPLSKHNRLNAAELPESAALDLFEQLEDGTYLDTFEVMKEIADASKAEGSPIIWGHDFVSHKEDSDHFELPPEVYA